MTLDLVLLYLPVRFLCLALALLIDVLFGEPPNKLHPVGWMGSLIHAFERRAPTHGRWIPCFIGGLFVLGGIALCISIGALFQCFVSSLIIPIALVLESVCLKLTFAVRGLVQAGNQVAEALQHENLEEARRRLSRHLVSRSTARLSESQVAGAAIESLAENTSDSIVAPIFFYVLCGLPGAIAYRFVNTCDAMMGYHTPRLEWLGKTAARTDDLLNLIPARLTGLLIVLSGLLLGNSPYRSVRTWIKDCQKTSSWNAGHPMSAMAGVLQLELEKVDHYCLGAGLRSPSFIDVHRTNRVVVLAVLLMVGVVLGLLVSKGY